MRRCRPVLAHVTLSKNKFCCDYFVKVFSPYGQTRDLDLSMALGHKNVFLLSVLTYHYFNAKLYSPQFEQMGHKVLNGDRPLFCVSHDKWGLCQYVMGPLNTSSRAPKTKRAGWQGFGGNIFVAHGGKIFAISLTSSFPVRFFSEPWKIHRPLQR